MAFQLDTSGAVAMGSEHTAIARKDLAGISLQWSDLTPFCQGFIRALFQTVVAVRDDGAVVEMCLWEAAGFSDLSPASLARIMGDCEARKTRPREERDGEVFWHARQRGNVPNFPPITLYLSDDGKVEVQDALTPSLAKPEVGEG